MSPFSFYPDNFYKKRREEILECLHFLPLHLTQKKKELDRDLWFDQRENVQNLGKAVENKVLATLKSVDKPLWANYTSASQKEEKKEMKETLKFLKKIQRIVNQ